MVLSMSRASCVTARSYRHNKLFSLQFSQDVTQMHPLQLAAFSSLITLSHRVCGDKCDDSRLVPHLMSCITPTIDFTRQIGFGRSLHRLGFSSSSLVLSFCSFSLCPYPSSLLSHAHAPSLPDGNPRPASPSPVRPRPRLFD